MVKDYKREIKELKYEMEDLLLQLQEQVQLQKQLQLQLQLQKQLQLQLQNQDQDQNQAQAQNDTDTISNVGNPSQNQNVNVTVTADGKSADQVGKLVDFDYDTRFSLNPLAPSTPLGNETTVAEVNLDNVAAGNQVLLNGLFHVDNDANAFRTLRVRIYRNTIAPANVIYDANFMEIDGENRDDQNQPIPVLHVDEPTTDLNNVTYILTAQATNDVLLRGPITLTASEIRD
ncbi:hypothetical protein [Paraliobacillus ryukyuensis]|uniref:hypothetical protein n=1 Tax=Paraliobacillus ryukyuensis TaxID=200904 RepID=UPI0009A87C2D|nr:hypothetical protein [Paraliobacillus ryukyuensis]